jgi:hypothetical protein
MTFVVDIMQFGADKESYYSYSFPAFGLPTRFQSRTAGWIFTTFVVDIMQFGADKESYYSYSFPAFGFPV